MSKKKTTVKKKSTREKTITKRMSRAKKPPHKRATIKKRRGRMSTDQHELVDALREAFSDSTQKPPELVPIPDLGYLLGGDETPERGKWIYIAAWEIHIKIKNLGGDMDKDKKISVKLKFMDGLYRGEGDTKTDVPQEFDDIDALDHDCESKILKFSMPSKGEHPFDPEFPIEIIIDEGKEWQSSTRLYLMDPRN